MRINQNNISKEIESFKMSYLYEAWKLNYIYQISQMWVIRNMTSSLSVKILIQVLILWQTEGSTTVAQRSMQFLVEVCRFGNVIPGNVNLVTDTCSGRTIQVSTSLEHSHLPLVGPLSQGAPGGSEPFEHSHLPGTFLVQLGPEVKRVPLGEKVRVEKKSQFSWDEKIPLNSKKFQHI